MQPEQIAYHHEISNQMCENDHKLALKMWKRIANLHNFGTFTKALSVRHRIIAFNDYDINIGVLLYDRIWRIGI